MRVALSKKTSTKAERIFAEMLKKNHIEFIHRFKLSGREIDFLIGTYAIEIDGHPQNSFRNTWLVLQGFTPLHYTNREIREDLKRVEEGIIRRFKPNF